MKAHGIFTAALICMTSMTPAAAADSQSGKTIALRWCAACHLVANDQERASDSPLPSFYEIAADPAWQEEALKTFLADPHPKMPNMDLSNSDISDLARYITSLKP